MEYAKRIRLAKASAATSQKLVVIKTAEVEVAHLLVPGGQTIPTHEAQGQVIIHCLEGNASLSAQGHVHQLATGDLLHLLIDEPFSLTAKVDASLLVTMIAPGGGFVETIGG